MTQQTPETPSGTNVTEARTVFTGVWAPISASSFSLFNRDLRALEDAIRMEERSKVDQLLEWLNEALDGWEGADSAADSQFRVPSDPPCADEATIERIRAAIAAFDVEKEQG